LTAIGGEVNLCQMLGASLFQLPCGVRVDV